jgi:hypothetical protein
VLEFVPETIHSIAKYFSRRKESMPMFSVKLYMYQLARALAHIHGMGICHRYAPLTPFTLLLVFFFTNSINIILEILNHTTYWWIRCVKFLSYATSGRRKRL